MTRRKGPFGASCSSSFYTAPLYTASACLTLSDALEQEDTSKLPGPPWQPWPIPWALLCFCPPLCPQPRSGARPPPFHALPHSALLFLGFE